MSALALTPNRRIIVIDDNTMIHKDFQKILGAPSTNDSVEFNEFEATLLGKTAPQKDLPSFQLDFASQGEEGLLKIREALSQNTPFAMAFVDMRMPPGWDGMKTIEHIWNIDPNLQITICTAYSDHSCDDIIDKFGHTDKLLFLKKPFDNVEVYQIACAMVNKWNLLRQVNQQVVQLEEIVAHRTATLEQTNRKLNAIVSCSPDYILTIDREHHVSYMNRATEGRDINKVIGASIYDYIDHNFHDTVRQAFNDAFNNGKIGHFELQSADTKGAMRWYSTRIAPISIDGKNESLIYVATDITEQKALEQKFYQSQKMEAMGRLTGGIAHDFNNLLVVNLGYANILLKNKELSEKVREQILQIQNASTRAARLVKQLLNFSRQQTASVQTLNLNEIIVNLKPMLDRIIGEDLTLTINLCTPKSNLLADKGQIEQVIMNLVVNARDAMPKGGTLTIETENDADKFVVLKVTDTGTGMTKEVQAKIFEPFFTTKEVGKGTGLGLATVIGIVDQNKGKISVSSEIGHGTTFTITFPFEHNEITETEDTMPLKAPIQNGTESILLIEDEDAMRLLANYVLSAAGYQVVDAKHGLDALEKCESGGKKFDLILTDVIMPVMGGREFVERAAKIMPDAAIIFMSGYEQSEALVQGIDNGHNNYIEKPFLPAQLLHKVRNVLDGKAKLRA